MDYTEHFATRNAAVPQSQPLAGQVPNSAGGYVWQLDDWGRLRRFLILGSEGGTYYIGERPLTRQNAEAVVRCIAADGLRVVAEIVAISQGGRAPKNDPALFALALCAGLGEPATRQAALDALPRVARTGTHVLTFAHYIEGFRGWGRSLRRAIASWYLTMEPERLSLQLIKYRQRGGWTHRDLLRLAHPRPTTEAGQALLAWTVKPADAQREAEAAVHCRLVEGLRQLRDADPSLAPELIRRYSLPREAVPTELLNEPAVWDALLVDMPLTALIRNLAKMSAIGLLSAGSLPAIYVAQALVNEQALRKARVHPLTLLLALRTYASGRGLKGNLTWKPVPQVVSALERAFYLAFQNVEPTGKRLLLALDVSSSMQQPVAGSPLMASEAAAALALVTAATETHVEAVAFAAGGWANPELNAGAHFSWMGGAGLREFPLAPQDRLQHVVERARELTMGATDCALPMRYAQAHNKPVDAFVVFTDSETWFGDMHPAEALRHYRRASGLPARLVVVGLCSNGFTIADPSDAGMLDVVGFDTAVPALMADFIRS